MSEVAARKPFRQAAGPELVWVLSEVARSRPG